MLALLGVVGSLTLEPVEPQSSPVFETEPCESDGLVRRQSKVVGTAEAIVLHGCGGSDRRGLLALHTAGMWFLAPNSWIALERTTSDIIRRVVFVRDHLGSGELADGTRSVLYTIETLNGTVGAFRFGHTIVCTTGRDIACTKPVAFACEADGCTAPRLSRGVLIASDADAGEQRYALSAAPATEPRP